jgi:hypothetical protein
MPTNFVTNFMFENPNITQLCHVYDVFPN